MFAVTLLVTLVACLAPVSAWLQEPIQRTVSCWRDTTCAGPSEPAFQGSWDKFNFSPVNRTVLPSKILAGSGSTLRGNGSRILYDFGKLVGGIVRLNYSSTGTGSVGLAFSEAKNWTGEWSDASNGSFNPDGALKTNVTVTSEGYFEMPLSSLRGGFRYLTLFLETSKNATVEIYGVEVEISFQPEWPNLRAYRGYFSCSDDELTRIWYAGAYTLQSNAIPPNTGREFPILPSGWRNDADLSLGTNISTIYVDGSKRDRTVWPGDLAIAVRSILVSTGDWEGVRNTLNVLYASQASSGELPFAGPAISIYGSDTYHMATLIGTYDYFMFTNDRAWLMPLYRDCYMRAMNFITRKIDNSSMLFVTGTNDWGRLNQGGHNTEANMLMYAVLRQGAQLASYLGDNPQAQIWADRAAELKNAVNNANYDAAYGAYKDSDINASIYPQDGNSLALLFGVAAPLTYSNISRALTRNWIRIGSVAPELPGNLVGFGQSFEVKAHLSARQASRAVQLVRRAWGWYLSDAAGTASTCIEGYLSDGSFGYRASYGYDDDYSYTSHAHGWSTGPTEALTAYIVGLSIKAPAGTKWLLEPQFADLTHAEAGFSTPLGRFRAAWLRQEGRDDFDVKWQTPEGTAGVVVLSVSAVGEPTVTMDGMVLDDDDLFWDQPAGTVSFKGEGGLHSVQVSY